MVFGVVRAGSVGAAVGGHTPGGEHLHGRRPRPTGALRTNDAERNPGADSGRRLDELIASGRYVEDVHAAG